MNRTKIEWALNPDGTQGYTWNPITGCLNGCPYCYARKLANGRLRTRYLMNTDLALRDGFLPQEAINNPFYLRFWEERLYEPFFRQTPSGIFTCDMSDLFGIGIPNGWTSDVVEDMIPHCPQHRFYLLTKQPQNLINFSPFPDNCWVGVTATGLEMFNSAMANLQKIEAKVKYISFEPLLEKIPMSSSWLTLLGQPIIQWVIIGAQTKPTIYPKDSWVHEIEQACNKVGIPVFEKNNLYPSGFRHLLRQEMPENTD